MVNEEMFEESKMDELLEKCISYWKNGFILGSMDQFVNMNRFLEKQIHF